MAFSETLKRLRIKKGLSQQQLAEMIYVDRSSVTKWESGSRFPDTMTILRLSECLDADVSELQSAAEEDAKKPKIILVEEVKSILSDGVSILENLFPDACVKGFMQSSRALSFARKNPIGIAFLDIQMKSADAIELCRMLLEINPCTNVVFLTAIPEPSSEALKTGACGFLLKPLEEKKVLEQLAFLPHPVKGLR